MKNILKTILLLILCCTLVFAYACGEEEKPSADNNDATDTPDIPDEPGNTDEPDTPDEPEQPGNTDEPQQPAHTHTWVKGKATEPSCKEEGEQTYECSCGETKTEPIAKLSSHIWDDGKITKEATCADGEKLFTCKSCGETKTETIAKTAKHTWDAGAVTKKATCSAEGVFTNTCTVCGEKYEQKLPKSSNHTYDSGVVIKTATCKEAGERKYTCTGCGETKTEEISKLYTHTYDSGKLSGTTMTYTCTVCGNSYSETVEAPLVVGDIPNIKLEDKTVNGEFYSKAAQVLIAAADAYVKRGKWIQYDDTNFEVGKTTLRSPHDANQEPERANEQNTLYTNCAAWIHSLFWEAFDYNIVSWYTEKFIERTDIMVYSGKYDASLTTAQKNQICKEIEDILVPGDLIVTRHRKNGVESGGHIILYIGNGQYIHSTGANYNYTKPDEGYDKKGSVCYDNLADTYFKSTSSRYILNEARYAVLRPLQLIKSIPQKSITRFASMQGIVAQKLSTHPMGVTANAGDTITYTIKVTNTNDEPVTVEVKSTLAANTTLVSGGDSVSGNTLSWKFAIAGHGVKEVSYTVKISSSVSAGTLIGEGTTTVNGIQVYGTDTRVGNTLSEAQQQAIIDAANNANGQSGEMAAVIDAIYEKALGVDLGLTTNQALYKTAFSVGSGERATLISSNKMLIKGVRTLFGGRYVYKTTSVPERVQLVREEMLIAGDIIVSSPNNTGSGCKLYLVLNDGLLFEMASSGTRVLSATSSADKLEGLLAANSFVVLRPSLSFK
ncbi:MAG: C40 family peptidase [Clostridia bacterium]|nr:C40 family peptidase [Clostridia bacterium]